MPFSKSWAWKFRSTARPRGQTPPAAETSSLAHSDDHDLAALDGKNDRVVVYQVVGVELEKGAEDRPIPGGGQGIAYGRRTGVAGAPDGVDQYVDRFVGLETDQHRRHVVLLREGLDEDLVGGCIDRRIVGLDRGRAVHKPARHDL